jgi:tRNA(Arg) A34 adenosine deaminase TadA
MPTPHATERDILAGLGLLASAGIDFDPGLRTLGRVSHARGFNVHCLVIDNADGEVVALERNRIHADDNPLQHAEQVAVRAALVRLRAKRPRPVGMPVDKYYKTMLFMAPGTAEADFFDRGCTLYNTFDSCGMCAVTLLVAYMKRIAYLFDDAKFVAVYDDMKTRYFTGRDSVKDAKPFPLVEGDGLLGKASSLIGKLRKKVNELEHNPDPAKKVPLVLTLDSCHAELQEAVALLIEADPAQLTSKGPEREKNARTLSDLKRLCNIN